MAQFTITSTLGGVTASFDISPEDARMIEFLDDLRNLHYPEVSDGAGGTRVMTRAEVGAKWIANLGAGQVAFARALKQWRLNAAVSVADDLEGN